MEVVVRLSLLPTMARMGNRTSLHIGKINGRIENTDTGPCEAFHEIGSYVGTDGP